MKKSIILGLALFFIPNQIFTNVNNQEINKNIIPSDIELNLGKESNTIIVKNGNDEKAFMMGDPQTSNGVKFGHIEGGYVPKPYPRIIPINNFEYASTNPIIYNQNFVQSVKVVKNGENNYTINSSTGTFNSYSPNIYLGFRYFNAIFEGEEEKYFPTNIYITPDKSLNTNDRMSDSVAFYIKDVRPTNGWIDMGKISSPFELANANVGNANMTWILNENGTIAYIGNTNRHPNSDRSDLTNYISYQYPSHFNYEKPIKLYSIVRSYGEYGPSVGFTNVNGVAILTDAGNLWTWGDRNLSGQLGHGNTNSNMIASKVNLPSDAGKITQVTALNEAFTVLTDNNKLYSWGNQINGQLGNGQTAGNLLTPTEITLPNNEKPIKIGKNIDQAGTSDEYLDYNFVYTESGNLYATGSGKNYSLGTGNTNNLLTYTKVNNLRLSNYDDITLGYNENDLTKGIKFINALGQSYNHEEVNLEVINDDGFDSTIPNSTYNITYQYTYNADNSSKQTFTRNVTVANIPNTDILRNQIINKNDVFIIKKGMYLGNDIAVDSIEITNVDGTKQTNGGQLATNVAGIITIDYTLKNVITGEPSNGPIQTITIKPDPVLQGVEDVTINVEGTFDSLANVTINDSDGFVLEVDDSEVNRTVAGTYTVFYKIVDIDTNNTTIHRRKVTVGAKLANGIETKYINIGDAFTALEAMNGVSVDSGTIVLNNPSLALNTSFATTHVITYSLNNNETIARNIIVRPDPIINGMEDKFVFKNSFLFPMENVSIDQNYNIKFTGGNYDFPDIDSIGEYNYLISDPYSGKTFREIRNIYVKDYIRDVLEYITDRTTNLGNAINLNIFAPGYIVTHDNNYNKDIVGNYAVKYTIKDEEYNIETTKEINVRVKEDPQIVIDDITVFINDMNFTLFDEISISETYAIEIVDDDNFDVTSVGNYNVVYQVKDEETNFIFPNIIRLVTVVSEHLEDKILYVGEDFDLTINITGFITTHNYGSDIFNENEAGIYEIIYTITNNETRSYTLSRNIKVKENPDFSFIQNEQLEKGQNFDLTIVLEGYIVTHDYGRNIFNEPNSDIYTITYTFEDTETNTIFTHIREIEVIKDKSNPIIFLITIPLLIIVGLAYLAYTKIYKQKINK